uniref:CCHC-type domain-containing protein n=1 Tax=Meloidogyne enterolobii TaxID=390850 RepID=A0A6V7U0P4_MELEN|nr:unnamed protein product [Meloidogyne enterolobii]
MCEELAEALKVEGIDEKVLALFSGNGKMRYKEQIENISPHLLACAVDSPEFTIKLEESELKKVEKYKKACTSHPRLAAEGTIAQLLLSHEKRRVIFVTLGLCEQLSKLFENTEILVLDEAGQAPFAQLLSTTTFFPKLRKVLVTGDKFQLKVHLQSLPETIRENYGLDTCIQILDSTPGVDKTTLTVSFRSHEQIVKCVEAGAYTPANEVLYPKQGGEFTMLTKMKNFFTPVANSPIILLNQTSPMVLQDVSYSSSTPFQTCTCIQFIEAIVNAGFEGNIRVICLYSAQLREIGIEIGNRSLTGIQTLSADAMQGHETDLAIVVTTATQRNESGADKSVEFWADPARANVALSRGKHGLIIIGDLKYLMNRGGIWNRFISKAMEFTVVADSIQYCNAMQNTEAQYIRGTLHVNGKTVQDYNFYAGSAKSYNLNQYYPSNSDRPRRAEKREWAPSNCNRCGKRGHTERECRN